MTKEVRDAYRAGVPIFIGYVPAAVAFGILSKGCGISLLESFCFSALVFAGASQFIALNLLMAGMGPGGIILTTFLVNFRHFLMSACLSAKMTGTAKKNLFLMAFGVTDEVFSVLSFKPGPLSPKFVIILESAAYSAWVGGTVAGYVLGGFLPEILTKSMGVALYALLLTILLPEIRQSLKALLLTIASGALNTLLIKLDLLPHGWNIIACIFVVALAGSFLIPEEAKEEAYG